MAILKEMFKEEKERLLKMKEFYIGKILELPKGNIVFKNRGNKKYPYLVYREGSKVKTDYLKNNDDYLKELADLLGLKGYPDPLPDKILTRALKPLTEATGITLEEIKEKAPLLMPGGNNIPWVERVFETADRKYNFFSASAERDGGDGLPCYREPLEISNRLLRDEGYTYWFVTPHSRDSIHSMHRLPDGKALPTAYLHPQTAEKEGLVGGERIGVSSKRGSIEVEAVISDQVPPDTVMVYQGWWHASGAAVNNLTSDRITDFGYQAAYYDCLCRIDHQD